jgi:hypothetical protein
MQPPPVYSIPPSSALVPRWGKVLLGCSTLTTLLMLLIGFAITRYIAGSKPTLQTQFCIQNLRNAQRGLDLYSQDYDQTFPQSAIWMDAATPYVKNRTDFKCPVVRVTNPHDYGYAFNRKLSGYKTSKIEVPQGTAEVYDSTDMRRNATDAFTSLPSPPRHLYGRDESTEKRSFRGNSVLYTDGHVRLLAIDGSTFEDPSGEMRQRWFGRRRRKK